MVVPDSAGKILVTGATGYIGGRLIPQLLEKGYRVRCLAREPRNLSGRDWETQVEIVSGDVLDRASLDKALEGCSAAYYLVHSMAAGERGFENRDRTSARNFADAAQQARVSRIIYLGGLGRRSEQLSHHLSSRHEVGDLLRQSTVPVTELRAAMIIGSGSASFEMMRALVSRLPVMICPRWVETRSQPIAIRDVLAYLIGCLANPATQGQTLDIGGSEVLTYREMMERFSKVLGLSRRIIVVPVLTPRLSAYWVNLVTPIPAGLAFPLIEGLRSETICENDQIRSLVPLDLIGFDESIRLALAKIKNHSVETRWAGAGLARRRRSVPQVDFKPADFAIRDEQKVKCAAPVAMLFDRVRGIGGDVGWYYANTLWRIRGAMDRVIGGVGLRRGRRDSVSLRIGDALDFWRVADIVPGERLLLHAEMHVPGDAWLEFRVNAIDGRHSELVQTAYFQPVRFWGRLYWNLFFPAHHFIFRGMAENIARAAERDAAVAKI